MTASWKFTAAAVAAVWLCWSTSSRAAGLFPSDDSEGSKEPIEIVADRLVANNTEKWADFTGNVKVTQGTFTMTSDALRIYYEGDLMNPPKDKSTQQSVQRMVATGRVHIVTDRYVADTERAEHVVATDVLTLTGPNSKVVSGKNTLTGSKIVLYRSEGKAFVEGSESERVKALFYQEPKGTSEAGSKKPAEKKEAEKKE
jgi:lipopolysaccharide export system protein LptA